MKKEIKICPLCAATYDDCDCAEEDGTPVRHPQGGRREGAGRKPVSDPRIPLPFRLKTSAVEKAKRLGRDRIEAMIRRAKER